MLERTVVEVCKRGGFPKPPQDRGGVCASRIFEAAPGRIVCSQALRVRNDWGKPVSQRAMHPDLEETWPPWIFTFVVKEEWPIRTIPGTRHGPCSVRGWVLGGVPPALGVTEKISPPWSDGTFGTSVE